MTVAPMTEPSSLKCWSMPSLRPRMSGLLIFGASACSEDCSSAGSTFSSAFSSAISIPLELDLDVDAGRKVELHQRVDRLLTGVVDVNEPLVRADLELLARVLVDERALDHGVLLDARGQRDRTGHRRTSALRGLDDLRGRLVDQLVVVRLETDPDPLLCHYSRTFVTTPAPTVWPPSRMAKRTPVSRAIGVPRVTSQVTLSPGMTISVPSGSLTSPVTSVVRR